MPSELEEILASPNGAEFVGADIHIHSYGASSDVTDSGMVPEGIVAAAIKKGLRIIALTDHNNCRNVRAAIECAKQHKGQLVVVPGTEITTANGHVLAYFPEVETLEKFISRLDIKDLNAGDGHTDKSMASVLVEIGALGGFAIAAHVDRDKSGFERFVSGYQGAKRDILRAPALRGLEVDDAIHLGWYSHDDTGPNSAERKQLLRARSDDGLHGHLAHIQNSDAHSLLQFSSRPIGTRVKVQDLTYASFELAFRDPSARVVAVGPIEGSHSRIIGMRIVGGFLNGQTFHFNRNLNCLFGGRGTGKSTAIGALAYALGQDSAFPDRDNMPDRIVVYVQDEHGSTWSIETKGNGENVTSSVSEPGRILESGSFQIEYYPQNAISRISEDLSKNGALLQDFMDGHLHKHDLFELERFALSSAQQAAVQLEPLEAANDELSGLEKRLKSVDRILKSAEDGKFKEVVKAQSELANERNAIGAFRRALDSILRKTANLNLNIDAKGILEEHEPLLGSTISKSRPWQKAVTELFGATNVRSAKAMENVAQSLVKLKEEFESTTTPLLTAHERLQARINAKIAEFEEQGLRPTTQSLGSQVAARTKLSSQIAVIKEQRPDLEAKRLTWENALVDLYRIREDIEKARREQLTPINASLAQTIDQFKIFFRYDPAGNPGGGFTGLVKDVMTGSNMHDTEMERLCAAISPQELTNICKEKAVDGLKSALADLDIAQKWAAVIVARFSIRKHLYALATCWKPPIVRIRVIGTTKQEIPIKYLSDGQRHTILLTVAMLGSSFLPLVIDQPEDDLDNAFISSTIVQTLRRVKERRQVIVVTHNANIVVLGDGEQLFPMVSHGEHGRTYDVGSIDHQSTRNAVEAVLEGGRVAFLRRAELYGIR